VPQVVIKCFEECPRLFRVSRGVLKMPEVYLSLLKGCLSIAEVYLRWLIYALDGFNVT
jgi:hypothetical protein